MKRYATLFVLLLPLAVSASAFAALPGGMSSQQDDLGIPTMDDLKKEEKPKVKKEDLPPINMVYVKGGCFEMGDASIGDDDEKPAHEVCVSNYYISDTEVTQELWEKVMGTLPAKRLNPQMKLDPKQPITYVSWNGVQLFIQKLNEITNGYYRLPSEAEWEFAARNRGEKKTWPGVDNEAEIGDYAWYAENGEEVVHKVKQKKPNGLGLYDMAGNAWEWVEDYFDFDYYQTSPKKDPTGPEFSLFRTLRGGSSWEQPYRLRSSYRYAIEQSQRKMNIGFRLAE